MKTPEDQNTRRPLQRLVRILERSESKWADRLKRASEMVYNPPWPYGLGRPGMPGFYRRETSTHWAEYTQSLRLWLRWTATCFVDRTRVRMVLLGHCLVWALAQLSSRISYYYSRNPNAALSGGAKRPDESNP